MANCVKFFDLQVKLDDFLTELVESAHVAKFRTTHKLH